MLPLAKGRTLGVPVPFFAFWLLACGKLWCKKGLFELL
jgi:hypothetical protein